MGAAYSGFHFTIMTEDRFGTDMSIPSFNYSSRPCAGDSPTYFSESAVVIFPHFPGAFDARLGSGTDMIFENISHAGVTISGFTAYVVQSGYRFAFFAGFPSLLWWYVGSAGRGRILCLFPAGGQYQQEKEDRDLYHLGVPRCLQS
jgi:hypothetical protein